MFAIIFYFCCLLKTLSAYFDLTQKPYLRSLAELTWHKPWPPVVSRYLFQLQTMSDMFFSCLIIWNLSHWQKAMVKLQERDNLCCMILIDVPSRPPGSPPHDNPLHSANFRAHFFWSFSGWGIWFHLISEETPFTGPPTLNRGFKGENKSIWHSIRVGLNQIILVTAYEKGGGEGIVDFHSFLVWLGCGSWLTSQHFACPISLNLGDQSNSGLWGCCCSIN